jgi:hypothetical protein
MIQLPGSKAEPEGAQYIVRDRRQHAGDEVDTHSAEREYAGGVGI